MRLQVRARPHRQVSIPPLRRASRLALSDAPQTRAESKSLGGARDREHVERPEGQNIHLYVNIPG